MLKKFAESTAEKKKPAEKKPALEWPKIEAPEPVAKPAANEAEKATPAEPEKSKAEQQYDAAPEDVKAAVHLILHEATGGLDIKSLENIQDEQQPAAASIASTTSDAAVADTVEPPASDRGSVQPAPEQEPTRPADQGAAAEAVQPAEAEATPEEPAEVAAPGDISFSRNATKMETVQDVLDFGKTGELNLGITDALFRGHFADAYVAAKSAAKRKELLKTLGDETIEYFADSKIRVSRWIQSAPLDEVMKQRIEGDLRRSDTVRSQLETEVKNTFTNPMMKAISKAAKDSEAQHRQGEEDGRVLDDRDLRPRGERATDRQGPSGAPGCASAGRPDDDRRRPEEPERPHRRRQWGCGRRRRVAWLAAQQRRGSATAADIESKIDKAHLQDIAKHIYAMMDHKKAMDLRSGKITQTAVNSWLNSPRYVPMTGDPRFDRERVTCSRPAGR
jgi:hypothetical protein